MANEPKWWNEQHTSAWDRVKTAFKRDWEQTKSDVSSHGKDLNQGVTDTVKQAVGKEAAPNASTPNPPDAGKHTWEHVEGPYRYGVGAQHQYSKDGDWTDRTETKLKEEWGDMKSGRTWDEVKTAVRRGWDRAKP